MIPDIKFLRQKVTDLNDENLNLKSENAYLKGEIAVYERFLMNKGTIAGDDHAS